MSDKNNKIIGIDAGNTSLKIAYFSEGEITNIERYTFDKFIEYLNKNTNFRDNNIFVISSVLSESRLHTLKKKLVQSYIITNQSKVPFDNQYETPETLGIDRICNAMYAYQKMESEYAAVIDIGTCIKFDLVHIEKGYLGGSISPGIDLRYKSLNDYTDNLPLLFSKNDHQLIGKNTEGSIHSGVINGMESEINGFIERYRNKYEKLTFFVTGGDAKYFDIHSKNDIFADENLTITGLYEIYKHNA